MSHSVVHLLPPAVANQIAAGEVVERPASIVKELVENSLDAGARRIRVRVERAGRRLIEVDDDGCGMSARDAEMAMRRHATSKLSSAEELTAIASHGFRGEALPSIASVSRLDMHTALADAGEGTRLVQEGGGPCEVCPAPPRTGTRVRVRDLFFNTPARARFLRSDRTEEAVIVETMRALALASPRIGFVLECDGRKRLDAPPATDRETRVRQVLGRDFAANQRPVSIEHHGIRVHGCMGLPTCHHRNADRMFFFVNGRVVRDRQLIAALRAGYRDVMFHDRFPQAVLWLEMDPALVDVNVHPAKREVRFRCPQDVRAAIIACARAAIAEGGQMVASTVSEQALAQLAPAARPAPAAASIRSSPPSGGAPDPSVLRALFSAPAPSGAMESAEPEAPDWSGNKTETLDLGTPLAQIHRCYILAQTADGIVLVDQHAAAERIAYETLKRQLRRGGVASQRLLTPERWQPDARIAAWLHDHLAELERYGFEVTPRGEESFEVLAMPAQLAGEAPVPLLAELVEALMRHGAGAEGSGRILERWLGNRACKGAIKSGRVMSPAEQEALLRQMEQTPNIAQCNHGRPTYARLSLAALERLFGRKE